MVNRKPYINAFLRYGMIAAALYRVHFQSETFPFRHFIVRHFKDGETDGVVGRRIRRGENKNMVGKRPACRQFGNGRGLLKAGVGERENHRARAASRQEADGLLCLSVRERGVAGCVNGGRRAALGTHQTDLNVPRERSLGRGNDIHGDRAGVVSKRGLRKADARNDLRVVIRNGEGVSVRVPVDRAPPARKAAALRKRKDNVPVVRVNAVVIDINGDRVARHSCADGEVVRVLRRAVRHKGDKIFVIAVVAGGDLQTQRQTGRRCTVRGKRDD